MNVGSARVAIVVLLLAASGVVKVPGSVAQAPASCPGPAFTEALAQEFHRRWPAQRFSGVGLAGDGLRSSSAGTDLCRTPLGLL